MVSAAGLTRYAASPAVGQIVTDVSGYAAPRPGPEAAMAALMDRR